LHSLLSFLSPDQGVGDSVHRTGPCIAACGAYPIPATDPSLPVYPGLAVLNLDHGRIDGPFSAHARHRILKMAKMSSMSNMLTMLRMDDTVEAVNQEHLRPAEVARYYNVSTSTILRWARAGRLKEWRLVTLPSGQHRYIKETTDDES
jgi:excisionase family DNA binding protein